MKNRLPIREGILTGLISSIFAQVVFTILDKLRSTFSWQIDPGILDGVTGLLTLLILATGIYAAMHARKRTAGGNISWAQAVLAGIVVSLLVALIGAIAAFIYGTYINPGFTDHMISETTILMVKQGKTNEEITRQAQKLSKELSTPMLVVRALIGQFIAGTIISLTMALFFQTKSQKSKK
jgi:hypothetical protein